MPCIWMRAFQASHSQRDSIRKSAGNERNIIQLNGQLSIATFDYPRARPMLLPALIGNNGTQTARNIWVHQDFPQNKVQPQLVIYGFFTTIIYQRDVLSGSGISGKIILVSHDSRLYIGQALQPIVQ